MYIDRIKEIEKKLFELDFELFLMKNNKHYKEKIPLKHK